MKRPFKHCNRRGSIVVIVALILPVLLIISGLVINKAYMELSRTELQIATDAATRAAGRRFVQTNSQSEAMQAARTAAAKNTVGGVPGEIESDDLIFGSATRDSLAARYTFVPNQAPFNAVQIRSDALSTSKCNSLAMPINMSSAPATFTPFKTATASVVELDVCLVVDRSGSMAYAADEIAAYPPAPINSFPKSVPCNNYDSYGNLIPPFTQLVPWEFGDPVPPKARWLDAIAATSVFLDVLATTPQQEMVGLVTYNHIPAADVQLTTDYPSIVNRLNFYSLSFQAGGTNIGDGILGGLNVLATSPGRRAWSQKVLIVLTDGIHNIGTSPRSAAQEAKNQEVVIYTVTFSNEADQNRMQEVAEITSGKHFHASDAAQLVAAFESIARSLPTLLTE